MSKLALHWQIFIALILAGLAGSLTGTDASLFGLKFYDIYVFLGTLFINALKMLIVPLIVSAIITGMFSIGTSGSLGQLGTKTLVYYMATSFIAIMIGLVVVNAISPGIIDGQPAKELIGLSADTGAVEEKVAGKGSGDVAAIFLRMVPPNIVSAAAAGQMLGLIFFSLLFGYFTANLKGSSGTTLRDFWNGVFEVMMKITDLIMKFAPIGVFGLVAKVVATTGYDAIKPLFLFFITVLIALAIHFLVSMPLLLKFVGRVSPWRMYRAMAPALLTAFSTSSSSATLPLTMDCVEKMRVFPIVPAVLFSPWVPR